MPNPQQYLSKLEAYTEGKNSVAMQSDVPRIIEELIGGVPEQALRSGPFRISGLLGQQRPSMPPSSMKSKPSSLCPRPVLTRHKFLNAYLASKGADTLI